MSNATRRCTHCGVEVRPAGQADICWSCRGSLRPGEEGPGPQPSLLEHWSILLVVSILTGVLSLTKVFVSFYVFPLWFIVVPILLLTRYIFKDFSGRGVVRPSLPILARFQLFSITAFYFVLPGIGDGGMYWVFGSEVILPSGLLYLSIKLSAVTAAIFVVCTGAIFFVYWSNRPSRLVRKSGKPARLGRRPNQ